MAMPKLSRHVEQAGRAGQPRHIVRCDGCGFEISVVAAMTADGQANRKLAASGWRIAGKRRHCPICAAEARTPANNQHKPEEAPPVMIAEPKAAPAPEALENDIRQPSLTDRRAILERLEDHYDRKAGRYCGGATDATIAQGLGVPLAWVTDLREMLFGPAGDNDDMAKLAAEIAEWKRRGEEAIARALEAAATVEKHGAEAKRFEDRLDAIRKTVGPKGARL